MQLGKACYESPYLNEDDDDDSYSVSVISPLSHSTKLPAGEASTPKRMNTRCGWFLLHDQVNSQWFIAHIAHFLS